MKTEAHESAYPWVDEAENCGEPGLSKREYFAALALQGLLANDADMPPRVLAGCAVEVADSLIEKLNAPIEEVEDWEPTPPVCSDDVGQLFDALGLVMEEVPSGAYLAGLTKEQRGEAFEWAINEHLIASDNDIDPLPKPDFLRF